MVRAPGLLRPGPPAAWVVALVLLLYAAAVLLRMPEIVLKGRFWAEEGSVFFVNAWQLDPGQALLLPYGGYLNLVANAATLAARWSVPLADAPYVTIGVALLFQLLPPFLLLSARDAWLRSPAVRLGGVALLLVVPAADEIWLQSLHCQFELALASGLILALDVPRGPRALLPLAVLLLAPLCGPGAIALTPLFLLRAAVDRSGGRAGQLAALLVGTALQLGLFFTGGADRVTTLDPAILLAVVTVKNLAVPFLGLERAGVLAARIHADAQAGQVATLVIAAPLLVFGAMTAAILHARAWPAFWLLAAAAASALLAYIGALDGTTELLHPRLGARYAVVPASLVAIAFLALATRPIWRWPAASLCVWLFVVGERAFVVPWPPVKDGPAWSGQVALWQADPAYPLQLWPRPWTVRLPPVR